MVKRFFFNGIKSDRCDFTVIYRDDLSFLVPSGPAKPGLTLIELTEVGAYDASHVRSALPLQNVAVRSFHLF